MKKKNKIKNRVALFIENSKFGKRVVKIVTNRDEDDVKVYTVKEEGTRQL